MPHAIIKTTKNLDQIKCVDVFLYKNRGIVPLSDPYNCFLDIYKKQNDLLVIKLNKTTRFIVTDELKNLIYEFAKKVAKNLNSEIIHHNLKPTNTHMISCDCFKKIFAQKKLITLSTPINNLEIGFGKGEFLLYLAEKKPDEAFFGIEIYGKDYLIALNNCCNQKLKNVKLINYDAKYALDLFENNSFDNIYVNFPEPWFKIYRIRHSIFNMVTFKKIVDKIKPHGTLHVVTDNYAFSLYSAVISHHFGLKPIDNRFISVDDNIDTMYAKKWRRKNRIFYKLELKKNFASKPTFYKTFDFPVKLKKLNYKDEELIFKVLGIYENKSYNYKIIEVVIGNYLAQHVFFGFSNNMIFLLPQTYFIYTKDFCDCLDIVLSI